MVKNKNFGFTLVELSIVLVIIGLLIGGILIGQSLIESAKINKLANEISQYDIAIDVFKTKHKALPADYSNSDIYTQYSYCAGTGNGGNQDGFVEIRCSRSDCTRAAEMECFWWVLYRAKILNDSELDGWHNNSDDHTPKYFGNKNLRIDFSVPYGTLNRNRYVLYDYSLYASNQRNNPGLTSIQAKTYDTKFDDGIYYKGYVVSTDYYLTPNTCINAGNYNLNSSTTSCVFNIVHKDSQPL